MGGHRRRLRSLLPDPLLPEGALRLHATALLMGGATAAIWVFGQDVLTDVGGLSGAAAIWSWAALGICGLLGAAAGDLAHRIGLRPAWALCTLVIAGTTALLGLLPGVLSAASLSALLPPSRLVSARTEEMNVLTQEQIRAHAERRSSS